MDYTKDVDEFELIVKDVPEVELPPARIIHKQIDYFIDKIGKVKQPKDIKVNIFQKVWAFLNGKKTIIGAGLTAVGTTLTIVGATGPVAVLCLSLGVLFGGTGGLHKLGKNSGIGEKGEFGEKEWLQVIISILNFILKLFTKGA